MEEQMTTKSSYKDEIIVCEKCFLIECCCEADKISYLIENLEDDLKFYHINTSNGKPSKKEMRDFISSRRFRKGLECSCEAHTNLATYYDGITDEVKKSTELEKGLLKILRDDISRLK